MSPGDREQLLFHHGTDCPGHQPPVSLGTLGERSALMRLWLAPVKAPLKVVTGVAEEKSLAEITPAEAAAFVLVFGYAYLTGRVLGYLAGNLAAAAVRGPARR